MKVSTGVETLELLATNFMGTQSVIHPTLIHDDETVILVDAGYPGQLPQIREAIEKTGVPFARLNKVIITHQDLDHIGSLANIRHELPVVEVLAHAWEKPYIQGELRPIKMTPQRIAQREAQFSALPQEQRRTLKALLEIPTQATVDRAVADGEELPYCGGINVIHTPGHTPGHVCLYLRQSKTLVTGDALNHTDGRLVGPNPLHTYEIATAVRSLKKLGAYDIETVICYHGGVYRGDANRRIAELADGHP